MYIHEDIMLNGNKISYKNSHWVVSQPDKTGRFYATRDFETLKLAKKYCELHKGGVT